MNHTGRTPVGRRRQASRKRLVIGATRINMFSPCFTSRVLLVTGWGEKTGRSVSLHQVSTQNR
jgi:hypothetical protein